MPPDILSYIHLGLSDVVDYYDKLNADIKTKLDLYLNLIKAANLEHNLTGFKSDALIFEKFILESLVPFCVGLNFDHKNLLDIGSGAGLPGMVLAIVAGQINVILIEKSPVKVNFQNYAIKKMEIANVKGICQVFSDSYQGKRFDYVSTRAYKPFKVSLYHSLLALKDYGTALMWRGKSWENEINSAGLNYIQKRDTMKVVRYDISSKTGGFLLLIKKKPKFLEGKLKGKAALFYG